MQKGFTAIILLLPLLAAIVLTAFLVRLNTGAKTHTPPAPKKALIAVATALPEAKEPSIPISFTAKANDDVSAVYTNNSLNFKFTYSKGFLVQEDTEEEFNKRGLTDFRKNFTSYVQYPPADFKGAVAVLDNSNSYDKNVFSIWIFDNPNNVSIGDWYKKYWYYPFVWGDFTYEGKFQLSPQREGTVSGQPTKSGIIDYQSGKPKFTYLSKDGKMFLFRTIGSNGEAMLNTFTFLK